MDIQNTVQSMLDKLKSICNTETVVGEAIEVAGIKLIPINKLSIGFGAALLDTANSSPPKDHAQLRSDGAGVGGGIRLKPMAFIAIAADGSAQLLSLDEPEVNLLDKLLQIVPELAEQVVTRRAQKKSIENLEPASMQANNDEK